MNTKKLGYAFVAVLFAAVLCMPLSGAWADQIDTNGGKGGNWVLRAANAGSVSSLYDGGYMRDVLTVRQPTPWRTVRHYVGNKPKLIVRILKEQGISLDPAIKYSVGTVVTIPQKYVLKELLPSPSQAEVTLKEAEHRAAEKAKVAALLKENNKPLVGHWLFHILSALIIGVLYFSGKRWHEEYVGANVTADVLDTNLTNALESNRRLTKEIFDVRSSEERYKNYVMLVNGEKTELEKQLAELEAMHAKLLAQTPGSPRVIKDNNGKEHKCHVSWVMCNEGTKENSVWLRCDYCGTSGVVDFNGDKAVLRHISRDHPEKMDPDPKMKVFDSATSLGPTGELQ